MSKHFEPDEKIRQIFELEVENERLRNERDAWRDKCLKIHSTAEKLWGEDWDVDLMENAVSAAMDVK